MKKKKSNTLKYNNCLLSLYDDGYIERKAEEYIKLKENPSNNYIPSLFEGFLWKEDIVDKCKYHERCSNYRIKKCLIWGIKSIFMNEIM